VSALARRVRTVAIAATVSVAAAVTVFVAGPFALARPAEAEAAARPAASTWIVVSDVHFSPFGRFGASSLPSTYGSDTNQALLDSLLAELKRAVPNPPVVVIAGDFLGHGFPVAKAAATMAELARRFDATYPRAQFVITLGNNDSDCGDYEVTLDGPFLQAVARAWQPLVDRHGAAPGFERTFAHDGAYVTRLPVAGLRAVVVNDVYDSVRYRNACGHGNPAATSLGDLTRMLGNAGSERTWLVTHVPPGIDAFSTAHLAHRLLLVPFLRPGARERLVTTIDDPRNRVALVIAGHTHHFSFRLSNAGEPARDVPILVAPSVSPIFGNAPSFLSLSVAPDGTLKNVVETSYVDEDWKTIGDLADQGVAAFTAPQLAAYELRLDRSIAAREAYERLYSGGAPSEINESNWRIYRCAMSALSATSESRCTDSGGLGVLTERAVGVLSGIGAAAIFFALALFVAFRRLRRRS
jgi:predicted phosphodiesterase